MTDESRSWFRPVAVTVGGAALMALGAVATYVAMSRSTPGASTGAALTPTPAVAEAPMTGMSVTLSREAVGRAGIELQPVVQSAGAGGIRVPGTIQPNAYRTAVVTSLVGGRVARVAGELGQPVRRGQTLAEVYSPELAEAQTRFVGVRAELDAHERELRRTENLAEIGAASRQELERIHAAHTAAVTLLQSHRARLTLLGMSDAQIETLSSASAVTALISITSPLDGVVTRREANIGINVDPSMPLFTVVDLSTVWAVGDISERDMARIRIGSPVSVTSPVLPLATLDGKVSYIDPQIQAETRTVQVRVELVNRARLLRLGMYVEMQIGGVAEAALAVPRAAVQVVGSHSVVYVASPGMTGRFTERAVVVGPTIGDLVTIVSGLELGELVAAKGSFAIRAETERLGRPAAPHSPVVRVTVSEKGFAPDRVPLRAGVPARVVFVRTTDATCATEILVPSLGIKRALPLNQPVEIAFTPEEPGDIAFACGMGMFSGTIVVR